MQTNAKLYDIEKFGKKKEYTKAIFLDHDTFDKIGVMIDDEEAASLSPLKGKNGVLTIGLVAKGYDYAAKFQSFKAAA